MHLLEIFKEAGNGLWFTSAQLAQEVLKHITMHQCTLTAFDELLL